jgi:hypothetical protein
VGATDGPAVGADVGDVVGRAVGAGVGVIVHSSETHSIHRDAFAAKNEPQQASHVHVPAGSQLRSG